MNKIRELGAWSGGLLALAFSMAPAAESAEHVLEWDPVIDERVSNYTIYYGEGHADYDRSVDAGNQTSFTFSDLDPDVIYYFAVKANDGNGEESDFSNELTSGTFRYVFGMNAFPNDGGWIEVSNVNQIYEQEVAVGWSEYNALNGETRIATGDIDGDGRDEVVIGFAPVEAKGLPGGRFQILDDDFSPLLWGQVNWPDYNDSNGETRPAIGDIDGDGKAEILIGLGPGGKGLIQIFKLSGGSLSAVGWTEVDWPEYNAANGETRPAAGDIDGDGRDEVVVGLGNVDGRADIPGGTFMIKRGIDTAAQADDGDITNRVLVEDELILGDLSWAEYANQLGDTRPALGDLNGDGSDEIVIGLGQAGSGNFEIFDYRGSALVSLAWAAVDWPDYNAIHGETRPAIGDIDGDQKGEILVGLAAGGNGQVDVFDDASRNFNRSNSLKFGTDAYRVANGGSWPAFKKERSPSAIKSNQQDYGTIERAF